MYTAQSIPIPIKLRASEGGLLDVMCVHPLMIGLTEACLTTMTELGKVIFFSQALIIHFLGLCSEAGFL